MSTDQRCVDIPVWVPVRHPLTGERMNAKARFHDHLLSASEAEALNAWFDAPSPVDTKPHDCASSPEQPAGGTPEPRDT